MNILLNKFRYLLLAVMALTLLVASTPQAKEQAPKTSVDKVSEHLFNLPLWWEDQQLESPEDRKSRMYIVADTQLDVVYHLTCLKGYDTPECEVQFSGDYRKLVGLIITAGFWETRYSRRYQLGDCRKKGEKMPLGGVAGRNECDSGRARSVYQVQNNGTFPEELWENSLGLSWEAHRNAAMAAGLSFVAAWNKCSSRGDYAVWGAYAMGKCRTVEKGVLRAHSYQKRMREINKLLPKLERINTPKELTN